MEKEVQGLKLDESTLNTLVDLLNFAKILQEYLNDQVVQDVSKILSSIAKLVNAISGTDLVDIIERALQDPNLDKVLVNPPRVGLIGLLKTLSDKDVQKGMGIMLQLLKAFGKASSNV
jgi:uncharacterized protein YjgD (DUF1641 family)